MNTNTILKLILALGAGLAQSMAQSDDAPACGVSELLIAEGIPIPSLREAQLKSRQVPWGAADSQGIRSRQLHVPSNSGRIPIFRCDGSNPGRLSLREQKVSMEEIREFVRAGRVFAYLVRAVWLGPENPPSRLGSMSILYIYDSTGSGQLDTVVNASKLGFRIKVPQWVNALE